MRQSARWRRLSLAIVLASSTSGCRERAWAPIVRTDSIPRAATTADLPAVDSHARPIRLGFVGDLMQYKEQTQDDFHESYARIAPYLRSFDLTIGNLEFPVDSTLPPRPDPGTHRFNGSTRHLDAIADAGFDVLQTANNHCFDRGVIGMVRTLEAVESRGMRAVGTARSRDALWAGPLLMRVNGLTIAFRAYTQVLNVWADSLGRRIEPPPDLPVFVVPFYGWRGQNRERGVTLFQDHVAEAHRAGADFVVALVHWGNDYYARPTAEQRNAGHDLIDAGFDLVVGTHSHVLNGPEVYRGKLIAYSMGNFLAHGPNLESRTGAVLQAEVVPGPPGQPAVLLSFGYLPVFVRFPQDIVVPLDSTGGPEEARAWTNARRVLGSSIVRH